MLRYQGADGYLQITSNLRDHLRSVKNINRFIKKQLNSCF